MIYATLNDATQAEVIAPIEATGIVPNARAEYDVPALQDAVIVWHEHYNADGTLDLNGTGFTRRPDLTAEQFWDLVQRHELAP